MKFSDTSDLVFVSVVLQEAVEHLYNEVMKKYLNMGAAKYLRDYRRAHNLKKSAELRKRVLQRREKRKEKADSVTFQVIYHDYICFNFSAGIT